MSLDSSFREPLGIQDALYCLSVLPSPNWTVFILCNCILCNHMFTFLMFITGELHSVLLPQYLFASIKT